MNNKEEILIDGVKPLYYKEIDDEYIAYTLPILDLIGFKRKKLEEINKIFPYNIDIDIKAPTEWIKLFNYIKRSHFRPLFLFLLKNCFILLEYGVYN